MTPTLDDVKCITNDVARQFRCFGGGRITPGNPLSAALADGPAQFAAGVDVADVVAFVLSTYIQLQSPQTGVSENPGVKLQITLKDPDALSDAIDGFVRRSLASSGLSPDEIDVVSETRRERLYGKITGAWMEYGEYLTIEFNTVDNTMRVVPRNETHS